MFNLINTSKKRKKIRGNIMAQKRKKREEDESEREDFEEEKYEEDEY
ncbi:MAG: hypothetical protein JW703_03680 [Candidatus Diapherotrites archaeon]|nr:hypothetical protein [Candidatus Diapherotrites archaeon]